MSPSSNGLIEQHDALVGLKVTKTINGTNCDLQTAVVWTSSAKNSLTSNGFSLIQLVFSNNPNYPTLEPDLSAALENTT